MKLIFFTACAPSSSQAFIDACGDRIVQKTQAKQKTEDTPKVEKESIAGIAVSSILTTQEALESEENE